MCVCVNFPVDQLKDILAQVWQTLSLKGQIINILDFAGHKFSVATIQFCPYNPKTAIDDM